MLTKLHEAILRGAQLVERERQFAGSFLNLPKQSRVLDGDHGLVGEGLDKLDLAGSKRARLRPCQQ